MLALQRSEQEDQRVPKGIQKECVRLCRPEKYGGRFDIESIEVFIVSLEMYLRLHSGTEESKVIVASCLLKAET